MRSEVDGTGVVTRVAHLTTVDLSLEYLLLPQLLAVRDAGGEAIGISAPGPSVEVLREHGIRHISLEGSTRGMDLAADLRAARHLRQILAREQFDVLHTHNPKPGIYGRLLGRASGVPVIVNTVHGLYAAEDDGWLRRGIVYSLEAIASRCSDAELFQNVEDLELAQRLRLVPAGRSSLLGNGVDLRRFDPSRADLPSRADVRRSLGVAEDTIVIGIVARLVAEKGYVELIEALDGLAPAIALVAVGPRDHAKADRLPEDLIDRATEAGAQFLGMRHDVDALYRAFDVFVLPSHREGFPRAAMEAAAMGLPIVAADVRGCRQVVDDGRTGRLVPVRSAEALRGALVALAHDPGLRRRWGAAARRKALVEFDERVVVERVLDTYRAIAARKRRRLFES